jgi:hypothetical protein
MDHAGGVSCPERCAKLPNDRERLADAHRSPAHPRSQRLSLEQLHRQERNLEGGARGSAASGTVKADIEQATPRGASRDARAASRA